MEYSKIVSVTGLPGLYELINTKNDGAIVRSLDDKTTKFASSRIHNFSHLESIEVFTVGENVNLVDVFQAMEKASGSLPDVKDEGAIKKYFQKVYPDIDFERVYNSDLKKMIKWYDALSQHHVELKLSEPEPEEETKTAEVEEKQTVKQTEKKKTAAPSEKSKPATKKTKEKEEEKPKASKAAKTAKKTAKKKKK